MGYAPQKYQGIAGSLAALFRNLGMGIGVSIATTSLYYGMSVKAGKNIADYPSKHPNWFLSGMHFAYMTALVLLLIAIVLVYMIHRIDKKENN
ncbi:hypothetical protein [Companilactobacillus alimentarius]|nr:hypothetical protein [Companilactobacillus alimentarius]MDT6953123.1 hypothetical protein [Companilactobacillus alimentarius]